MAEMALTRMRAKIAELRWRWRAASTTTTP